MHDRNQPARDIVAETPRLIIRLLTPDDLDALAALLADPAVMRFSGSGTRDRAGAERFIAHAMESYRTDDGRGTWAMVRREDTRMIGYCGYFRRETDGVIEDEIGYRLAPSCWGMGLATEAMLAVRDTAFIRYGVARLTAVIDPPNAASIRVAEKIGMRYEREIETHGRAMRVYAMRSDDAPSADDRTGI